jgi:hypothetical protein
MAEHDDTNIRIVPKSIWVESNPPIQVNFQYSYDESKHLKTELNPGGYFPATYTGVVATCDERPAKYRLIVLDNGVEVGINVDPTFVTHTVVARNLRDSNW